MKHFENAKNRLSSEKCISFANFNLPFTLITDASGIAVAGILLQIEMSTQNIDVTIQEDGSLDELERQTCREQRDQHDRCC